MRGDKNLAWKIYVMQQNKFTKMRQQWVRCDAMSVRYKTSGCEALKIGERELKGVFQ